MVWSRRDRSCSLSAAVVALASLAVRVARRVATTAGGERSAFGRTRLHFERVRYSTALAIRPGPGGAETRSTG
eukprot:2575516-Prymnesium_polylepis.1